jgi:hypothetical protein
MLNLTQDELLVLFEWSYRFCETNRLAFSHHAEVVVIDKNRERTRTFAQGAF